MRVCQTHTGKSAFSMISSDVRKEYLRYEELYKPRQVLEPLQNILFATNASSHRFEPYGKSDYNRARLKAENTILKKIRICRIQSPMDSLTFSKDFIDTVTNILDCFDSVSNHRLFSKPNTDPKGRVQLDEFRTYPVWFEITRNNSIVDWVVSHFETRILRLYFQRDEHVTYSKMAIQLRDNYVEIWKSFSEAKKTEMINKALNAIDNFSQLCFTDNHLEPKSGSEEKYHQLKEREAPFKLLLMLNKSRESDRRIIKANLQLGLSRKLDEKGSAGFIRSSVACNIRDALHFEHFIMSLLVEQLEEIYLNSIMLSLIEDESDAKKKKPKKKKKKAKKPKNNSDGNDFEQVANEKIQRPDSADLKSKDDNFFLFDKSVNRAVSPIDEKGPKPAMPYINKLLPEIEGSESTYFSMTVEESLRTPLLQEYYEQEKTRQQMLSEKVPQQIVDDILIKDIEDPIRQKDQLYDQQDLIIRLDNPSSCPAPQFVNHSKTESRKLDCNNQTAEGSHGRKAGHHIFPDGGDAFGAPFKILNTKLSVSGFKNIPDDTLNALTSANREKSINFPSEMPKINSNFIIHAKEEIDIQNPLLLVSDKLALIRECSFESRSPSKFKRVDLPSQFVEELTKAVETTTITSQPTMSTGTVSEKAEMPSESKLQSEIVAKKSKSKETKKKSSTNSPSKKTTPQEIQPLPRRQSKRAKKNNYNLASNPFNLLTMEEEDSPLRDKNVNKQFDDNLKAIPLQRIIAKPRDLPENFSGLDVSNTEASNKAPHDKYEDSTDMHSKLSEYENSDRHYDYGYSVKNAGSRNYPEEKQKVSVKKKPTIKKEKKLPTLRKVTKDEQNSKIQTLVRPKPSRFASNNYKEESSLSTNNAKKIIQNRETFPRDNTKPNSGLQPLSNRPTQKEQVAITKTPVATKDSVPATKDAPKKKKAEKTESVAQIKSIVYWKDEPVKEISFPSKPAENQQSIFTEKAPSQIKESANVKTPLPKESRPAQSSSLPASDFKPSDDPNQTPESNAKRDSFTASMSSATNIDSQSKTTIRRALKINKLNANKIYIPQDPLPEYQSPAFNFNFPENNSIPNPVAAPFTLNSIPPTSAPFLMPVQLTAASVEKTEIQKKVSKVINGIIGEDISGIKEDLVAHASELEEARKLIIERLNDIVKRSFKNDRIFLKSYGSYETRILTPFSDMDLAISGCELIERSNAIQMLETIHHNLQLCPFVLKSQAILTAAVPVLKFEADASIAFEGFETSSTSVNIKVDVIVELCEEYNAPNTAIRTTEYINKCIDFYSSFYSNFLVLKYALNINDFSCSYKGIVKRRTQRVRLCLDLHRLP